MPTVNGLTVTLADRVQETTQTTGSGTYGLDGAATGKRTFVAGIGNGVRTLYAAALGANWEIGIGTVTSGAPATLSRDAILASTNSNNAVSWGAGTKDIFCDIAAALANQIFVAPTLPITRTAVATSSGTSQQFLTINSATKLLVVSYVALSTSGTSSIILQIGDSGGFELTGYVSSEGDSLSVITTGFVINVSPVAASTYYGSTTLILSNSAANHWAAHGNLASSGGGASPHAGAKGLTGTLDRIRITTANGTDTFDNGFIGLTEY